MINIMLLYVVEDDDSAAALTMLGDLEVATGQTTSAKWWNTYAPLFGSLSVVIIANRGALGRSRAVSLARSLCGRVESLKILELPAMYGRQDFGIRDWVSANGSKEALEFLCSREPEWQPVKEDGLAYIVPIAGVQPETVEWLWCPYLPKSRLTLLEGDPGVGKSWLSLAVAAAISLGSGLPAQESSMPAPVLLASAEDGLGDTIRPRLSALGADLENIHAIEGPLAFDDEGLRILAEFIRDVRPALVIVDPLVAYLGAGVDLHRANETRAVLSRLAGISEKYSASILAVRHLAKGGASRPIYRGLGSIDIAAACRSVLLAGCDPANPQRRAMVHLKSNLSPPGRPLGYEIRDGRFYWTGESCLTARQILAADDNPPISALENAALFLSERLLGGPAEARAVFKDANDYGIGEITLRRAKSQLKIVSRREGEPGKKGVARFVWELPPAPDS